MTNEKNIEEGQTGTEFEIAELRDDDLIHVAGGVLIQIPKKCKSCGNLISAAEAARGDYCKKCKEKMDD